MTDEANACPLSLGSYKRTTKPYFTVILYSSTHGQQNLLSFIHFFLAHLTHPCPPPSHFCVSKMCDDHSS